MGTQYSNDNNLDISIASLPAFFEQLKIGIDSLSRQNVKKMSLGVIYQHVKMCEPRNIEVLIQKRLKKIILSGKGFSKKTSSQSYLLNR